MLGILSPEVFDQGDIRELTDVILANQADVNEPLQLDGKRSLHFAAGYGYTPIIELLLSCGAQINYQDRAGLSPLHCAVINNQPDAVRVLLQRGANVTLQDRVKRFTALHFAAEIGAAPIVGMLVQAHADTQREARDKMRPLHIASEKGHAQVVALLLAAGAMIDTPDQVGWTPLHLAVENRRDDVAIMLIKHGADLSAASKYGWTPLHLAAQSGNVTALKTLLMAGADASAQTKDGKTPHALAVENNQVLALVALNSGTGQGTNGVSSLQSLPSYHPHAPHFLPEPGHRWDPQGHATDVGEMSDQLAGPSSGLALTKRDSIATSAASTVSLDSCTAITTTTCSFCSASSRHAVPDMFVCPLSKEAMQDPVVCLDGYTYERRAIQRWFDQGQRTSPLTGETLRSTAMIPNHVVRCALREWREGKARCGGE